MIPVAEALERVLALATPLGSETVPLAQAAGRVMTAPAVALRGQPPFPASSMDGYAMAATDARPGARLRVVGTARAGARFGAALGPGTAVRIFTGAPLPEGADHVVIQENVEADGDRITLRAVGPSHVRPAGLDFAAGSRLDPPRRLRPVDLALLAAMNVAEVTVARRPEVALIATGDELVMPGTDPGPDQILASNIFALKAMVEAEGARTRLLPIARDSLDSLETVLGLAEDADVVVTIGGVSVGAHDLVAEAARARGLAQAFWKIAMRPGKPLMAGRMGEALMLGLPGNPVSALVCGHLFLLPALRALQGLDDVAPRPRPARLGCAVGENGPRAHYMRAALRPGTPLPVATPFENQDSALLGLLAQAGALVIRPPHAPALPEGAEVDILPL
ncbi:MAG: molybdopterin molybdotransferase MoeA [Alkalilacustris sp.]